MKGALIVVAKMSNLTREIDYLSLCFRNSYGYRESHRKLGIGQRLLKIIILIINVKEIKNEA